MTPAGGNDRQHDRQPAPRVPGPPSNRVWPQVWWASLPICSIGFLSFVPFLAFAVIRRRKNDWAVFAAYLAATVAMIVAVGAVNTKSGGGAAVGGFLRAP